MLAEGSLVGSYKICIRRRWKRLTKEEPKNSVQHSQKDQRPHFQENKAETNYGEEGQKRKY